MKRIAWMVAVMVLGFIGICRAQNLGSYNGQCAKGGQSIILQGLQSSGTEPIPSGTVSTGTGAIGSYPSCTITVYLTGTSTLASLYQSNIVSPPSLANPFTANTDGSFLFFAASQVGYDITETGGGLPAPVTLTDIVVCNTNCGVAPTGAITVQTNGVNNTTQSLLNHVNANGCTWTNPSGGIEEVSCPGATLETNSSNNSSQSVLNFTNTTGAGGITASNPSGGLEEFTVANIQGTDGNLLSSGTISGTGVSLCTDANGGATTTGCPSSGGSVTGSGTSGFIPVWTSSTALGNSVVQQASVNSTTALQSSGGIIQLSGHDATNSMVRITSTANTSTYGIELDTSLGQAPSVQVNTGGAGQVYIVTSDGSEWIFNPGTNAHMRFPTSVTFANLGTASAGFVIYCNNCTVATPCTGSGGGAWAFANGSRWACPF